MEKPTPHCKLSVVKALVQEGKVRVTYTATNDAAAMGCDAGGIIRTVMNLDTGDFYKSMTTYADHTIWQDVYKPSTPFGDVYLKLTVLDDVLVVSFKEL